MKRRGSYQVPTGWISGVSQLAVGSKDEENFRCHVDDWDVVVSNFNYSFLCTEEVDSSVVESFVVACLPPAFLICPSPMTHQQKYYCMAMT